MATDRRDKWWVGSDRRPNLLYDSINIARVCEWELTGVLNFGVGLTDVPKCSTTITNFKPNKLER